LVRLLSTFFREQTSPINLAIARIITFGWLLDPAIRYQFVLFSTLPEELRFPIPWMHWMLPHIITNLATVELIAWLYLVACVLGLIGLGTRIVAPIALLLGLYVLGVPEFYGKINHNHHLIWFLAVLAVSPCGDALSLDSLLRAWRRPELSRPAPSRLYALPLRFLWLLLSLMYFFPGFWKYWACGAEWFKSDGFRNHLYNKWAQLGGWTPAFRIDQYHILCALSGLGTILFEIGFVLLIFNRLTRYLAAVGGMAFHSLIFVFMRISFLALQSYYLTFVEWDVVLRRLGKRLFPKDLFVLYDGGCGVCRKTVSVLTSLDLLERVTFVDALDDDRKRTLGLNTLDQDILLHDMHGVSGDQVTQGYFTYRWMAARLPLLWAILPLLYLPPVVALGMRIYRKIADSRACRLPSATGAKPTRVSLFRSYSPRMVCVVGALLFVLNVYCGFRHISSWPLSCYPAFDYIPQPMINEVVFTIHSPSGATEEFHPYANPGPFADCTERLGGMIESIVADTDETRRAGRLEAFWRVFPHPASSAGTKVQVRQILTSTIPGDYHIIQQNELMEFEPTPAPM